MISCEGAIGDGDSIIVRYSIHIGDPSTIFFCIVVRKSAVRASPHSVDR
jgi:hypothetical protein